MFSKEDLERLKEHISRSVADQLLQDDSINWSALERLDKPVLRIEACLRDGSDETTTAVGTVSVSCSCVCLCVCVCDASVLEPQRRPQAEMSALLMMMMGIACRGPLERRHAERCNSGRFYW